MACGSSQVRPLTMRCWRHRGSETLRWWGSWRLPPRDRVRRRRTVQAPSQSCRTTDNSSCCVSCLPDSMLTCILGTAVWSLRCRWASTVVRASLRRLQRFWCLGRGCGVPHESRFLHSGNALDAGNKPGSSKAADGPRWRLQFAGRKTRERTSRKKWDEPPTAFRRAYRVDEGRLRVGSTISRLLDAAVEP